MRKRSLRTALRLTVLSLGLIGGALALDALSPSNAAAADTPRPSIVRDVLAGTDSSIGAALPDTPKRHPGTAGTPAAALPSRTGQPAKPRPATNLPPPKRNTSLAARIATRPGNEPKAAQIAPPRYKAGQLKPARPRQRPAQQPGRDTGPHHPAPTTMATDRATAALETAQPLADDLASAAAHHRQAVGAVVDLQRKHLPPLVRGLPVAAALHVAARHLTPPLTAAIPEVVAPTLLELLPSAPATPISLLRLAPLSPVSDASGSSPPGDTAPGVAVAPDAGMHSASWMCAGDERSHSAAANSRRMKSVTIGSPSGPLDSRKDQQPVDPGGKPAQEQAPNSCGAPYAVCVDSSAEHELPEVGTTQHGDVKAAGRGPAPGTRPA